MDPDPFEALAWRPPFNGLLDTLSRVLDIPGREFCSCSSLMETLLLLLGIDLFLLPNLRWSASSIYKF